MATLFDHAKKNNCKDAASKNEIAVVKMDVKFFMGMGLSRKDASIASKTLSDNLAELSRINKKAETLEVRSNMIKTDIKQLSKDAFINMYEKGGKKPDNFKVLAENEETECKIIVMDDYQNVKKADAERLRKELGQDIVVESEVYSFNNEILEIKGYKEKLSKAVMSMDIPEEHRNKLLVCEVKYNVAKGTIDKLNTYGKSVKEIMNSVKPKIMLKDVKGVDVPEVVA
jgi:hypothetical protein